MLSDELNMTLKRALQIASARNHEYVTCEHLLLALMDDMDVTSFCDALSINHSSLKNRLSTYIDEELLNIVSEARSAPKPIASFQRIIQQAMLHVQSHEHSIVSGLDVLSEFFVENDSYALLCLKEAGVTRPNIIDYLKLHPIINTNSSFYSINNANNKYAPQSQEIQLEVDSQEKKLNHHRIESAKNENNSFEKYCTNLNKKAQNNDIDCLIGREEEVQRTIEILCRRKKNNIILIGEPGVGKTAIAEGLAARIVKKDIPDFLANSVIYSLNVGSLVAGTKFRGDFEDRVKQLLEAMNQDRNAILFIDEIHTIIGAGSTNTSAMDASNLLKPALAKGEIRCIGATTFKEYHNHFEKDMALVRRFQKIVIKEPDTETSIKILQGITQYYEDHHNVKYSPSALRAAVTLSQRFLHDRRLPDKAIDLIDEAGARANSSNNKANLKPRSKRLITDKDIATLISTIANIPQLDSSNDDIHQLRNLNINLKNLIFGQDEAIDTLCDSIKMSKAGLRAVTRPIGCYMFAGPTGVGKTELAKQLAILNNMKLIKFDMSEFSEPSSVSKLIGSAPGYVGFDQGGMLTDEVDANPYSVVLFDEIEKATPEIFNLLLQIMDEGQLTDSTGKHVSFLNTIIILTTNVGGEVKAKSIIGFGGGKIQEELKERNLEEVESVFSPELRSRIDHIILFNPIDHIMAKIVKKALNQLSTQLQNKNVDMILHSSVKQYLINQCSKKNSGARELNRVIDYALKRSIAEEILFGKLKNGGVVSVKYLKQQDKLKFDFDKEKKLKISNEAECI